MNNEPESIYYDILGISGVSVIAIIIADDFSGIGVLDDFLIPVIAFVIV